MALKIAVVGAGGVGGYFGGRLAQSGADVSFVARGAHLEAMLRNGLKIDSSARGDALVQPVKAVTDPAAIGPVDVVLFAVKLVDVADAAAAIKPLIGPQTMVVTLQNGVDSAEIVSQAVGAEHVVPGVAYIAAIIREPGVILHTGQMARIAFAESDGSLSTRMTRLRDACAAADIDVDTPDNIQRVIWRKFAMLAPFAGLTSLTRLPIGPIRETAESRALLEAAIGEVVAVGQALETGLVEGDTAATMKTVDGLPAVMSSSMAHDLSIGKPLELPWLSGAVVRLGKKVGIPTPTHAVIAQALAPFASGRKEGR